MGLSRCSASNNNGLERMRERFELLGPAGLEKGKVKKKIGRTATTRLILGDARARLKPTIPFVMITHSSSHFPLLRYCIAGSCASIVAPAANLGAKSLGNDVVMRSRRLRRGKRR